MSLSQNSKKAIGWILRKLLTETAIILLILFGSLAYMITTNEEKTREVLANNANAYFCDNAPECYSLDGSGKEVAEFGDLLILEIQSIEAYRKPWNILDLDRLAHAISHAETSHCTKGVGVTHNNCFGIRYNGKFARYKTREDSFQDFKRIWAKSYKTYPTWRMADRWTGGDKVDTWLGIVFKYYNQPL